MGSSEFSEWLHYLDEYEWKRDKVMYHYMAQLTATFVRMNCDPKKAKDVKNEDYLLKFAQPESQERSEEEQEKTKEQRSKEGLAWLKLAFGLSNKKK